MSLHLCLRSILAGTTPGQVVVDDPWQPRAGLAWFHSRAFLAGEASPVGAREAIRRALQDQLLPELRAGGQEAFLVFSADDAWPAALGEMLPGPVHYRPRRQYYLCNRLRQDWRPLLPAGFELRQVDRRLLGETGLQGLEALREEMISERPSVEDFLQRSFGVCLVRRESNELAGWCLSEYNSADSCEVGVATAEAYRRCGLGTLMALAFVEEALRRGIRQVGWECWEQNTASGALARRAGFELAHEFPVDLFILGD